MKIGIVTFHRAENFGAMLQAVALRIALERLGHEAFFVDYWPAAHQRCYQTWNPDAFRQMSFPGKAITAAKNIALTPIIQRRHRRFRSFFNKHIRPYCIDVNSEVDAAVYGSDQVWGRFPFNGCRFDDVYFASNAIRTGRHISYAASMGSSEVSDSERDYLRTQLKNFNHVSVRESEVKSLLESLGVDDVSLTCDPTLLLRREDWSKIISPERIIKKPYLLFYDLQRGCFNDDAMKRFAAERGLEIIKIAPSVRLSSLMESNELGAVGPEEFVRLIRDSEHVFTSSFHGLAFAILFGQNFHASYKTKAGRAQTILETIGLSDRLIEPQSDITNLRNRPIDYSKVYPRLDDFTQSSYQFLQQI